MAQKVKSQVRELESQNIPSLLWKFFVPAFSGVILNSLYNIVDRIFIGQGVGAEALSGVSAIFPVMIAMMAFGMLVGTGAGVRISISLGKGDLKTSERVLGNAFILMILTSLAITTIGFLVKEPILRMFGVNDDTIGYANEYLDIILLGAVFNVVGFSLNNLIRSEGNPRIAMVSMMISAGTNLLLDPIFIFGLNMGVKGAAIATVISQILLTAWVIWHFLSNRSVVKLKLSNFKLNREIVWFILSIGFAPFSMQLASSLVQGTFNKQLMVYGNDYAIGAMGIINSVAMLLTMTIIAMNMASQPIIGFNFGAKNYRRVKQTLVIILKGATIVSTLGFAIAQLFPKEIISIFNTDNPELMSIGMHGMRIALAAFPIVGFQIIVGNFFQSIGKAGKAAFISLLRQVIVLIPLLLILPGIWGISGVWMASPIADTIAAAISIIFLTREMKKLNRAIARQPE